MSKFKYKNILLTGAAGALGEQLRETLEQTSRKALMEASKDESEFEQEKLRKVPYPLYIG